MPGSNANAGDDMIRRLETELREKQTFANEIINRAQTAERDLSDDEKQLVSETRGRIEQIKTQLETIEDVTRVSFDTMNRARQIGDAVESMRGKTLASPVEYRSAGEWVMDSWKSHLGDRDAHERLELFYRAGAAHQKTPDNLGVVPDPIVGGVINFIDAARPLVSALGPMPIPSGTWHRPVVTQHTSVDVQGSAGAAADEKAELVSQKMTITRLNATAKTYGGYVNVSRQNIEFSQPSIMDIIVNDLAAQYAIATEEATADEIQASATTAVGYGASPTAATIAGALWEAVAIAYTAVKGQGRLLLVVAPDVLGTFGPLFAPVNPQNAQSTGFNASQAFGQGTVGNISGVQVIMSAGLDAGKAFVLSTAAIEVYEQRLGTLQVTEPSVLGVQVAYAGMFTPLTILDDAIIPLTAT